MTRMLIYLLLSLSIYSACNRSKQLSINQHCSDKAASNKEKMIDGQNILTFDCANGPIEIKNYAYFRIPMPCCCEIIDSVMVGNDKYIDYVVSWIENTSIHTINGGCNFSCRTKEDPVGAESELRGKRIFEALLKRLSDEEEEGGFECTPEDEGLFYPAKTFYRHLYKMIDNIDGQSYLDFFRKHSPDVVALIDEGKDYQCYGVLTKPVVLQLVKAHEAGRVKLKKFNNRD